MVKIIFFNLLRSKYHWHELDVAPGTFQNVIDELKKNNPSLNEKDFRDCVMFVNDVRITHLALFDIQFKDGDKVVLTHFLGGG